MPKDSQDQIWVFPSLEPTEQTTTVTATVKEVDEGTTEVPFSTYISRIVEPETPAPMPSRGDGPQNIPKVKDEGHQITQSVIL